MKKIFLLSVFVLSLSPWGRDGEGLLAQKTKTKVQEVDPATECPSANEDALKLYEKSRDKKKYEYKERIKFLEECVAEDPNYAPANYELGMHWERRADEDNMSSCTKC